jgi:hypothetical protein
VYVLFVKLKVENMVTLVAQLVGHYATSWKDVGSIPHVVTGFFN